MAHLLTWEPSQAMASHLLAYRIRPRNWRKSLGGTHLRVPRLAVLWFSSQTRSRKKRFNSSHLYTAGFGGRPGNIRAGHQDRSSWAFRSTISAFAARNWRLMESSLSSFLSRASSSARAFFLDLILSEASTVELEPTGRRREGRGRTVHISSRMNRGRADEFRETSSLGLLATGMVNQTSDTAIEGPVKSGGSLSLRLFL